MKKIDMKKLTSTFRFKLIIFIMIIILPLCLMLIGYNIYANNVLENEVSDTLSQTIDLSRKQIDKQLENIELYLINQKLYENDIGNIQTNTDRSTVVIKENVLHNKYLNEIEQYKSVDCIFVYNSLDDNLISTSLDESELKKYIYTIKNRSDDEECFQKWQIIKIGDKYKLIKTEKVDKVLIGVYFDIKTLLQPVNDSVRDMTDYVTLVGNDGTITNKNFNSSFYSKNNRDKAKYSVRDSENRECIVINSKSVKNYSLSALVQKDNITKSMKNFTYIMVAMMAIILVIVCAAFFLLKYIFIYPTNSILVSIKKIQNGEEKVVIPNKKSFYEINVIIATINKLLNEIKKLHINVYEEKLLIQQAEYNQLKSQTNPHFLINTLNTIYNISKEGKIEEIQKLSKCLFFYYRYTLRNTSDYVKISDEINFVENYIEIIKIRCQNCVSYEVELPEYLSNEIIPTLSIAAFVENSVKHGFINNKHLNIEVRINLDNINGVNYLSIIIKDDGKGYTDEELQNLNDYEKYLSAGSHIGIANVVKRLHYLYSGKATAVFRNENGAVVEMNIPLRPFEI